MSSILFFLCAPACLGRWACSPYSVPRSAEIGLQATIEYTSQPIWVAVADALEELSTPHYAVNQEVVRAIEKGQGPSPVPVFWTMKAEVVNSTGGLITIDPSRSSIVYPDGEARQLSALVQGAFTTAIPPQSRAAYTLGLVGIEVASGDIVRLYLEWAASGNTSAGQWSWIITEYTPPPSRFWRYFWLTLGGLWLLGLVVGVGMFLVTGSWPD